MIPARTNHAPHFVPIRSSRTGFPFTLLRKQGWSLVWTILRQTGVRIWSLRCLYRFAQALPDQGASWWEEAGMNKAETIALAYVLYGLTVIFIRLLRQH